MFRIKKKETPSLTVLVIPKIAFLFAATIASFLAVFTLCCFLYIYYFGCSHQLELLSKDENPVNTITETIELNESILGQFGFSKMLCTACAHAIVEGLF